MVEVAPAPAAIRAWDSAFFGVSIGQVGPPRGDPEIINKALQWAAAVSVRCLYLLVDADDDASSRAAEASRFGLVDVRVTLERAVGGGDRDAGSARIWRAVPADIPALTALARTSHRNTRFHRDRRFDPRRSDELYAVWIERSVTGELADVVWVVVEDGVPRGYLTLSCAGERASIGLVAVDELLRGQGGGAELLRAATSWAADAGVTRITVVTQGHNAAAVRFYERAGFVTSSVQFWYHRWLDEPGA